jgi:hypothetical protein
MGSLIKLAALAFLEAGKLRQIRAATLRMMAAGLCAGLAILLMLGVLGCISAALWLSVLPSLGPVGAPLIVAGFLALLALILAAAGWLILRPKRRRAAAAATSAALAPQMLMAEAARLFKEHKGAVMLAAVIAGMAAANGKRKG